MKYYTVVNSKLYFFPSCFFFSVKMRISICEVSEITSLCMTSLRFGLKEAVICVDASSFQHCWPSYRAFLPVNQAIVFEALLDLLQVSFVILFQALPVGGELRKWSEQSEQNKLPVPLAPLLGDRVGLNKITNESLGKSRAL